MATSCCGASCSGCYSVEVLVLHFKGFLCFTTAWVRYWKTCGASTAWRPCGKLVALRHLVRVKACLLLCDGWKVLLIHLFGVALRLLLLLRWKACTLVGLVWRYAWCGAM
jgi:hypothetical protein